MERRLAWGRLVLLGLFRCRADRGTASVPLSFRVRAATHIVGADTLMRSPGSPTAVTELHLRRVRSSAGLVASLRVHAYLPFSARRRAGESPST